MTFARYFVNHYPILARFRKIFFYFLLAAGVFFATLTGIVYLFKDRIINQFIREANKNLSTKVKIEKTDISWFERFPNLSIVLTNVYVEDSHEGIYPLLTAEKVSFQLKTAEALRGNLLIQGLQISGSETKLKINAEGINNYTITTNNQSSQGEGVRFALENVRLTNTRVDYVDLRSNEEYRFHSEQLRATIDARHDIYDIEAKGIVTTEKIRVRQVELFNGKTFRINSDLIYNDLLRKLTINPSELVLRSSEFLVEGEYEWKDKAIIDLSAEGKNTDIQTLLSLMPESVSSNFEKYRSKGDMRFTANLKGTIERNSSPALTVSFGFQEATIYHPEYKTRIEHANLEGSFASAHVANPEEAVLILKNINGRLNGKTFLSNLTVQNFSDSQVQLDFKGELDAASLADLYPVKELTGVSGAVVADINFKGRLSWLEKRTTARQATAQGSIELNALNFAYGKERIPIREINGSLQFNNNDLALSNVRARVGNSDFLVNGFLKNAITFLLFENQPIGIEADLKSRFLDLDELFALGFAKGEGSSVPDEYEFKISDDINVRFNCDIGSLRYKKFHAKNIAGDLQVSHQTATSRNIRLESMGGTIAVSGKVDAGNPKMIGVSSAAKLGGIYLDSVFYVFENFNQSFIRDAHLKGQAYADVDLRMILNPALRLFSETLVSDIGVVIRNGELNEFEPIKKLDKYLDDESLNKVRFSDLRNEIHIEKKKIYIPKMEVLTNVTNLSISGTHTLDQQIDYRIVTPLRSYRKINLGEARTAIEDNGPGQSKLFLKIAGTTDNYRVVYDTESVRKKISEDLKNEVTELKEIFRNKGAKQEKEVELEEEDYFDWEN